MTAIEASSGTYRSRVDGTIEEWRPVLGYEGIYSVSNLGQVKVHARTSPHWQGGTLRRPERILKLGIDTDGYQHAGLTKDGRLRTRKVHLLVLEAFIGPKPEGLQVAHGDGCRTNNQLTNLRYDTPKGNIADRVRHGTQLRGEAVKSARLTAAQVASIRASTKSLRGITAEFGISKTQASRIRRNLSWSHV